jgi:hypothetical protein
VEKPFTWTVTSYGMPELTESNLKPALSSAVTSRRSPEAASSTPRSRGTRVAVHVKYGSDNRAVTQRILGAGPVAVVLGVRQAWGPRQLRTHRI